MNHDDDRADMIFKLVCKFILIVILFIVVVVIYLLKN